MFGALKGYVKFGHLDYKSILSSFHKHPESDLFILGEEGIANA